MHHFLFEFITGGGLHSQELPASLANEGDLMLQSLLKELSLIDDSNITITRDPRMSLIEQDAICSIINGVNDEKLIDLIKQSDVAWLIAPETDDCLSHLAKLFEKNSQLYIGCPEETIKQVASKTLSHNLLAEAGINSVITAQLSEILPQGPDGWIVKPDDGVGAEDCFLIKEKKQLPQFLEKENAGNLIIQPYLPGQNLSMSLLVYEQNVCLLACNKQIIVVNDNKLVLKGVCVNEVVSLQNEMLKLAKKIVNILPGLVGYIGIDVLFYNDRLYVVDINPRLTTAFAGLSQSLSCNITEKILDTFLQGRLPQITLDYAMPVRIDL